MNTSWCHGASILYLQRLPALIANTNKFSTEEKVVLSKIPSRCAARPRIRESRRSGRLWKWWRGGRGQGKRSWGRLSIKHDDVGDGGDNGDYDDDDTYIMMKCLSVCVSRKMITSSWESPVTT